MNTKKLIANPETLDRVDLDTAPTNEIVDFCVAVGLQVTIKEKYGIVYDPIIKKWVKILTNEEAQKIIDEVDKI